MYRELAPPRALADLVQCFWTMRSPSRLDGVRRLRVLPDGCTDIIFNFGDPPTPDGAGGHGLRSYVVGTMTRAVTVGLTGDVDMMGVRFRSGAGPRFLGVDASDLTDLSAPLATLWPAGEELLERMGEGAPGQRAAVLARALGGDRAWRERGADPRVARALKLIRSTRGAVGVAALSQATGLGRRQLERLFSREVGVSPKIAARVARLEHAAALLRSEGPSGLARIAVLSGFHDQPHMTREFRDLAGTTPGAYRMAEG